MLRPRSILQLVLLGFGIVTVPLLAAFIATAYFVSDLGRSGQRAIVSAVDVIQESRVLVEQSVAMARNGRQYLVLDDPAVVEVYEQRRGELHQAADDLRALALTDAQRLLLTELEKREDELYRRLLARKDQPDAVRIDPWEFDVLTSLARGVLAESGQLITRNIQTLNDSANRVHRLLLWESIALVPIALGLGGIVVLLIIRPLRTLNQAIDRLGAGRFDDEVRVSGPRDLQKLGEQLESTRKRLRSLENQKVFFLRNISHELKTPLTTLREGTQLLDEQVVGPLNAEQQEIVDLLATNSIELQRLIEDLLHFGVSPTSSLEAERHRVDLAGIARDVLDEQRLPAQAKRLRIDVELPSVHVDGDPVKLKTLCSNLVSNAIKFSPLGGEVRVTLARREPWAVLEIRDQGPGISDTDRKRIFEAFFQGETPSYEGPVKGSGLGLFIAREFVQLHQGTIDVMDSAHGALLRIQLPLAAEADPADSDAARAAAGAGAKSDADAAIGVRDLDTGAGRHRRVTDG